MLPPDAHIILAFKAALRKRMRGLRNTAPASACLLRSAQIVAKLRTLPQVESAQSVALFWPIEARKEVDLRTLDAELRARGVVVAYPSINQDTREMCFRISSAQQSMEERGMGFSEPPQDAEEAGALDLIIAPALAVDGLGYRLGYGAGYYDRVFALSGPGCFRVAVAYDYQLSPEVPREAHDEPVHCVVTDSRILSIGK
jgi:5-formyltetrahydrofolate cyclo-ligase